MNGQIWGWKGEVELGETKIAYLQLLAFECKGSNVLISDTIFAGIGAVRFRLCNFADLRS